MWKQVTFCLLLVHFTSAHKEETVLNYDGDVNLAAFFPIHKVGENGECGEIQKEDGIQPLEAMLFTLDEINNSPDVLPGITLGAKAIDSCDNPIQASEKAFPLLVRIDYVYLYRFDYAINDSCNNLFRTKSNTLQ